LPRQIILITIKKNSGTSFSTPLVAGVVALMLQAHPDWDPFMVKEALIKTSSQSLKPDNYFGWGLIDAMKAINYTIEPICSKRCVNGYCNEKNECVCNSNYYNYNCDSEKIKCQTICLAGGCYEDECICSEIYSSKCVKKNITGWKCPTQNFNRTDKICHCNCGIQDPDCFDYNKIVGCEKFKYPICINGTCADYSEIITDNSLPSFISSYEISQLKNRTLTPTILLFVGTGLLIITIFTWFIIRVKRTLPKLPCTIENL